MAGNNVWSFSPANFQLTLFFKNLSRIRYYIKPFEDASAILKELQNKLNMKLDELSEIFGESFLLRITEGVKQMSVLLSEIKGPAANSEDPKILEETDNVLAPVLSTLDDSFELFSQSAEKTILKRILKALWKLLLNTIEKQLVLPSTGGNTLINAGKSAIEAGRKFGSALSGSIAGGFSGASVTLNSNLLSAEKTLTPRHCAVMNCAIENLKIFFHSDGMGLKKNFLTKSADLQSLQYALSLYTLSTGKDEALIFENNLSQILNF